MAKNKDYVSGLNWGRRTIMKAYREEGDAGLHRCDKAAQTCRKYATDMSIKKTSKGVVLNSKLRQYYKGIADGFLDGYNKIF